MQENGSREADRDRGRQAGGQDKLAQGAVLMAILEQFPDRPTILGLAGEINDEVAFIRFDAVERAVRDLAGAGLVRCRGRRVGPTRLARLLWPVRW
jgi:hypothetical protein